MPRPLRVLLVADHLDYDGALHGAGRQLLEMTSALNSVAAVEEARAIAVRPASGLGLQLIREGAPLDFLNHSPYDPRTALTLARRCQTGRVDILHLTDYAASTWGRIAGLVTRTPTVVHVRSHHSRHQAKGFPSRVAFAYRALAPFTSKAIAISESVREFAIQRMGFRSEQVVVLNNPLTAQFNPADAEDGSASDAAPGSGSIAAIRSRHGVPADARLVGAVTRFYPSKGMRDLIAALPTILETIPQTYLMLVGQGPEEPKLKELAEALGVRERVIFAGFRKDVVAYYRTFDVSAVPSLEEGFGNVAIEAMATGTPVVASNLGGLREIVQNEENGLLVPAQDPGTLARAIIRVLTEGELADRLRRNGRRRALDFSLDRFIDRLTRIYQEVRSET